MSSWKRTSLRPGHMGNCLSARFSRFTEGTARQDCTPEAVLPTIAIIGTNKYLEYLKAGEERNLPLSERNERSFPPETLKHAKRKEDDTTIRTNRGDGNGGQIHGI